MFSAAGDYSEPDLLRLAASSERGSEHPLANAIVRSAAERNIGLRSARSFNAIPGKGVQGEIEERTVLLGNLQLFEESGIDAGALRNEAERLRRSEERRVGKECRSRWSP